MEVGDELGSLRIRLLRVEELDQVFDHVGVQARFKLVDDGDAACFENGEDVAQEDEEGLGASGLGHQGTLVVMAVHTGEILEGNFRHP